jgi:hypothetical protein
LRVKREGEMKPLSERLYPIRCPTCGENYGVTLEGNRCCCDGQTMLYAVPWTVAVLEEWDEKHDWRMNLWSSIREVLYGGYSAD